MIELFNAYDVHDFSLEKVREIIDEKKKRKSERYTPLSMDDWKKYFSYLEDSDFLRDYGIEPELPEQCPD